MGRGGSGQIIIRKRIESALGTAENAPSGFKEAVKAPTDVIIFNQADLNGQLNVYSDMMRYTSLRLNKRPKLPKEIFFLAVNVKASNESDLYKNQQLGGHTVCRIFSDFCENLKMKGIGLRDRVSALSRRATCATRLLTTGHNCETVYKKPPGCGKSFF